MRDIIGGAKGMPSPTMPAAACCGGGRRGGGGSGGGEGELGMPGPSLPGSLSTAACEPTLGGGPGGGGGTPGVPLMMAPGGGPAGGPGRTTSRRGGGGKTPLATPAGRRELPKAGEQILLSGTALVRRKRLGVHSPGGGPRGGGGSASSDSLMDVVPLVSPETLWLVPSSAGFCGRGGGGGNGGGGGKRPSTGCMPCATPWYCWDA
eukprot:scaffold2979_cov405-Prasinococcus_capsulatus_cf.AAC.14